MVLYSQSWFSYLKWVGDCGRMKSTDTPIVLITPTPHMLPTAILHSRKIKIELDTVILYF